MKILYSAVALRVISARARFTQQLANLREYLGLEITALFAINGVRHTKSADPVPYKQLCTSCGTLVGD